jgi:hypothetical protein
MHQLFIDVDEDYDSVKKEGFYNILIEFGTPMKLVRLIKMCLNDMYSTVRVDKNLSSFLLGIVCKKEMLFLHVFQFCFRIRHEEGSGKPGWIEIKR